MPKPCKPLYRDIKAYQSTLPILYIFGLLNHSVYGEVWYLYFRLNSYPAEIKSV